jgi:hypothetical protein
MNRVFLACIAAISMLTFIPVSRVTAQSSAPSAQTMPAIELARRYTDLEHGFSLCPPANTTAERVTSPTQLISWTRRQAGTQFIQWTLAVQRVSEPKAVPDLKVYARAIQEKFPGYQAPQAGQAGTTAIIKVGQKDAFEVVGLAGNEKLKLWQKQVWVQTSPTDFLILAVSGPQDGKALLEAILTAVSQTLEFVDPKVIEAQAQTNLEKGKALLSTWSADSVSAVLSSQPRWFLITRDNVPAGCLVRSERMVKRAGVDGLETVSRVFMPGQGGEPAKIVTMNLFATPDQTGEQCELTVKPAGLDKNDTILRLEAWTKADGVLKYHVSDGGKDTSKQTKVPQGSHLTSAGMEIVTRMADLSKPGSYAFMVYNSGTNSFDTWQLSIIGPINTKIDGKEVACVKGTIQPTITAEAGQVLLDDKGNLLQLRAQWMSMDATTAQQALKIFPEARGLLQE